jgi:hypothetical protein
MLGAIRSKQNMQVVARRFGITKLELNRLAFLDEIADCNRSCFLIGSHQIPHQKVTAFKSAAMFVDGYPNVQGPMRITATGSFERFKHFLEARNSRFSPEFKDHVLFRSGDHVSLADRTTSLRDHRPDGDGTRDLDCNDSPVEHLAVLHQAIVSRATPPSG